jgi:hypothetical protein
MQDPDRTMIQIGMEPQGYLEIIDEFLEIVKDKIAAVNENIETQSNDAVDLKDLMEGAKLLRAERVTDILDKLSRCVAGTKPETFRSFYPVLLRELKAMQHHLTRYCTRSRESSPGLEK